MAKTRLELLTQELDNINDIIEYQFIERDICLYCDDLDGAGKVMEEIGMFHTRKEAVLALIQAEHDHALGKRFDDWQAIITITAPSGS